MSTAKHTAEPWTLSALTLVGATGHGIASLDAPRRRGDAFRYVRKVDAERIVACVNACAGMEDPMKALEDVCDLLQELAAGRLGYDDARRLAKASLSALKGTK